MAIISAAGTALAGAGAVAGKVKGIGQAIGGLFGGGKSESPADKSKQKIQKKLSQMGHPEFSSMSGWKGDEKKKKRAMQIILATIQKNPASAKTIKRWLEGGKITPGTIQKIKRAGFANTVDQTTSGSPQSAGVRMASATTMERTQQPGKFISESFGAIPSWMWLLIAGLVGFIAFRAQ